MGKSNIKIPITNPSSDMERTRLNYKLIRDADIMSVDKVSTWSNYMFRGLSGGKGFSRSDYLRIGPGDYSDDGRPIIRRHAAYEKARFIKKFGMDSEELMEKLGFMQLIYEDENGPGGSLTEMLRTYREERPRKGKSPGRYDTDNLERIEDAIEKGLATEKELEEYRKTIEEYFVIYQKMLDSVAEIDGQLGERALNRMRSKSVLPGLKRVPSKIPVAGQIDTTTITGVINFESMVKSLEDLMHRMDKQGKKISDVDLSYEHYSRKSKGDTFRAEDKTTLLSKFHRRVGGHLTNYRGGVFEAGMAYVLAEGANELLKDIGQLGTETGESRNATIEMPHGELYQSSTSKTDVEATVSLDGKHDIKVNFSNKAQSYRGGGATKAFDSSLATLLKLVVEKRNHYTTLQAAYLGDTKDIDKAKSEFNKFLGALLVDYSLGGAGGDRIDYMAYEDEMLSLYEYMERIKKSEIKFSKPGEKPMEKLVEEYSMASKNASGNSFTIPAVGSISARVMVS